MITYTPSHVLKYNVLLRHTSPDELPDEFIVKSITLDGLAHAITDNKQYNCVKPDLNLDICLGLDNSPIVTLFTLKQLMTYPGYDTELQLDLDKYCQLPMHTIKYRRVEDKEVIFNKLQDIKQQCKQYTMSKTNIIKQDNVLEIKYPEREFSLSGLIHLITDSYFDDKLTDIKITILNSYVFLHDMHRLELFEDVYKLYQHGFSAWRFIPNDITLMRLINELTGWKVVDITYDNYKTYISLVRG
jgi:hypothetical protein